MSDIIHLLPDAVANQIAAGEVVQRPASVIKELLENAIDAHATEIQIVLKEAGRDLIQVIDNGVGMSATDARMAFERHATSKISKADDLFALHTMGFRGEALASIVAVAEVELRTRRSEDEVGICLSLAGCKLLSQESVSCPVGANFQIRNLFYNVPARRKFLKSNQTELSNIITEVQHVALANPSVGFTFIHNDVMQFQLKAGSLRQRIASLFAKTIGQQLLPIGVDNELLTVGGFICQPESARKKGALQYFFVNNRYMKHPYFHKAVMECYSGLISEGEQPNYFIYLTVDPATIDVNIHPTKTEIKFENENARWHILMAAIREGLGKFNVAPAIDFDMADAPEIPSLTVESSNPEGGLSAPKPQFSSSYNPFKKDRNLASWDSLYNDFASSNDHPQNYSDDGLAPEPEVLGSKLGGSAAPVVLPSRGNHENTAASNPQSVQTETIAPQPVQSTLLDAPTQSLRYFQANGRYIMTMVKSGILIIDQHRAHVAVLFKRYITQIQNKQGVKQPELFPEVVSFTQSDIPVLEKILPELNYLGFDLDNLGGGAYSISAKPATLGSCDVQSLLLSMLEVAREHETSIREDIDKQMALKLANAEAIPYGKMMNVDEMEQLADSLFALDDPNYTPEGKPIISMLGYNEIASRF